MNRNGLTLHRFVLALFLQFAAALCVAQSEQIIRYNGGSDDRGQAVVTDAAGSIYVGGSSHSQTIPAAFTVLKHNAQGTLQWASHYSGPSNQIDGNVAAIGTDAAGNVYAAGYIARQLPFLQYAIDWLVTSFTPNGVQRWSHVFGSPNEGYDQASSLVVDQAGGAVYVTGISGLGNDFNWLTIKYSFGGAVLWQRTKSGALSGGDDRPVAMKLDAAGNVVILGYTTNVTNDFHDVSLVKYDPQGNVLWSRDYADGPRSDEFPAGLALDAAGNAYVTGITAPSGPEGPQIPFLLKYAADGTLQFANKGEGFGGSSVAVGPDGNIAVAGVAIGDAASTIHAAVSKLTPAGVPLWSVRLDPTGNTYYEGRVGVGADGSVYFGGHLVHSSGFDFFAAKFTGGGQQTWRHVTPDANIARDVHLAANGDLFIAGENDGSATDMLVVRLSGNALPPSPPSAPSGLALTAGKGQLKLMWSDNAGNETGYRVERSISGAAFAQIAQVGANVKTFTDTGLNKKTSYSYRVRAFNASGNSAYSATVTGKPQ